MKRAQITVFIIVGLFALIILGLLLYMKSIVTEELLVYEEEQPVTINSFISSCLGDVGEEGIFYLGETGGYYTPPELSANVADMVVSIYINEEEYNMPNLDTIESELNNYIENELGLCLNNFSFFTEQGWEINSEEYSVVSEIIYNKIMLELNYEVSASKEDSTISLDTFTEEINLDFYSYYNIINELVNKQMEVGNYIMIGDLAYFANDYGFEFIVDSVDESHVLYNILFDNEIRPEQPYVYNYIVRYDWAEGFE